MGNRGETKGYKQRGIHREREKERVRAKYCIVLGLWNYIKNYVNDYFFNHKLNSFNTKSIVKITYMYWF